MWVIKYDENLQNNFFFKKILSNHKELITKVSKNEWILCIPRSGSFKEEEITIEMVFNHILIPTKAPNLPETFSTLSEKSLTIADGEIMADNKIRILFQETFYNHNLKYSVYCVENPLFSSSCDKNKLITLDTLHDCIDFLWDQNLEHLLVEIQKLCNIFCEKNRSFQLENLQTQLDLIGQLYSQCLQLVFKDSKMRTECCENFKLAVETYMQSCLGRTLIRGINTVTCFPDGNLNKHLHNIQEQNLIDPEYEKNCDNQPYSEWELNKINNFNTILDKINCLKLTFKRLYKEKNGFTTDDILHSLIALILKSDVTNWYSNLMYINRFQFSGFEISGEESFLISSLEAALEFLKTYQNSPKTYKSSGAIFDTIAEGDLNQVESLLDYNRQTNKNLCHPLCDCRECLAIASPVLATINEDGQNLLNYATIVGRQEMVEFLIDKKVDSSKDNFGKTPLHYACQYGHQSILLILLNNKCDVNAKDNDGNTPLHLASFGGHDHCVKALFYTERTVRCSVTNNNNETPLYLAVKYNFIEIVRVLLENGALENVEKKKGQIPLNVAQNYYTERLLRQHLDFVPEDGSNITIYGRKPKSRKQNKKIDLLLKAIESNDLPMAYFYLGFPIDDEKKVYEFKSRCHPLCICDKCEEDDVKSIVVSQERLSVNTCNVDGFTSLHFAAKYGRSDLLRLLLDAQALPNVKTYKTLQTPLHLACIHQRINIVKELVKCGDCEIDALDYKGNTPLYYSYVKGDTKLVEILLSNGAKTIRGSIF